MQSESRDTFYYQRLAMVERQLKGRDISDQRVLETMMSVPRHDFVPDQYRAESYTDNPLAIGYGQTISQPYIVALMTQVAGIDIDSVVLEIGTGSGYQTAILATLAKQVYSIEIVEALHIKAKNLLSSFDFASKIVLRCGNGHFGWEVHEPYDAILVTAAPQNIPEPLIAQLKIGGRLVVPIGDSNQELVLVTKTQTGHITSSITPVRFVPMTGEKSD